jgi:hypothetical protein
MRRALLAAIAATVVLALGVLAGVNSRDPSADTDDTRNASDTRGKHDDHRGGAREKADRGAHGDHGPPAWAHGHGQGPRFDKAAREEWKELTPEQRRTLMDRLIREHMAGMREWRSCMVEGRDGCELPLPPGLGRMR